MRVTYNELITLSIKCFNSLNLPLGESDRIANMVADLELVGYSGLEFLLRSVQNINDTTLDISIAEMENGVFEIDLNRSSVAFHLPAIMYYARQQLLTNKTIVVKIKNAYNRWLAYGELKRLSERGYCVYATWGRRSVDQTVHYLLNENEEHPNLYFVDEKRKNDVLEIHISSQKFRPPLPKINTHHISSYNLTVEKEKSVRNGVFVKDTVWNALCDIAKKNLVANTEQSEEKGAGGI